MREVFLVSKDKRMYKLCSDKLKTTPDFVIFIIEVFIKDSEFVNDVIANYFNKAGSNLKCDEMCIMLASLYEQYKCENLSEYKKSAWEIYEYEKLKVNELLDRNFNLKWQKEVGIGFRFILEQYSDSMILPFFMAENVIIDLLEKSSIEKELHKKFKLLKS